MWSWHRAQPTVRPIVPRVTTSIRSSMMSRVTPEETATEREEAHRRQRRAVAGRDLIGGDLEQEEAVVGHVVVEGLDDPVAIGRGLHEESLLAGVDVALGVGVPGHVQPVPGPLLAVMRRGEQAVDHAARRRPGRGRRRTRRPPRGSVAGRSGRSSRGGSACAGRPAATAPAPPLRGGPARKRRSASGTSRRGGPAAGAGSLTGWNAQWRRRASSPRSTPGASAGQGAPAATQRSSAAICPSRSVPSRRHLRSSPRVPDGIDQEALVRAARARPPARIRRRRRRAFRESTLSPPFCFSAPWHLRQFSTRSGRISFSKASASSAEDRARDPVEATKAVATAKYQSLSVPIIARPDQAPASGGHFIAPIVRPWRARHPGDSADPANASRGGTPGAARPRRSGHGATRIDTRKIAPGSVAIGRARELLRAACGSVNGGGKVVLPRVCDAYDDLITLRHDPTGLWLGSLFDLPVGPFLPCGPWPL